MPGRSHRPGVKPVNRSVKTLITLIHESDKYGGAPVQHFSKRPGYAAGLGMTF